MSQLTEQQKEQLLNEQLNQLKTEIKPGKDLWAGIDLAIESEQLSDNEVKSGSFSWQSIAATVAIVSMVGYISLQGPAPDSVPQITQVAVAEQLISSHQLQKQAILASYGEEATVNANWQTQMNELDEAALAIKAALKNSPENPALLQMLRQVHQQQINVIENAHKPRFQQI